MRCSFCDGTGSLCFWCKSPSHECGCRMYTPAMCVFCLPDEPPDATPGPDPWENWDERGSD